MRPLTPRIVAVVEVVWLILIAWHIHHDVSGAVGATYLTRWSYQVVDIADAWAIPAIAIVACAWLIDRLVGLPEPQAS